MYQFVFANLFPKYYSKFNSRGVENNIEFTSFYSKYLNEKSIIEWQKNAVCEVNPSSIPVNDYQDSESDSDVVVVDVKKVKKEEEEEANKQRRLKRKEEMQKQKKN